MAFLMLIIEDGSQVANANSYTELANARTVAAFYGITLTTDDTALENNLIAAYNWLNTLESQYQGVRLSDIDTDTSQTGVWPRKPVYIRGNLQDGNSIPLELIESQVVAAYAAESGSLFIPPTPSTTGAVIEESLDGVGSVKYAKGYTPTGLDANQALNFAKQLLEPLLETALGAGGGGMQIKKGYS